MSSPFDYDVFLSFASTDMDAAKDIWQTLTRGGIRVFWSTDTLKETVGQSFVSAIQESLVKSQHFVLYWTANAKASNWVEAEYQAFYSQCHLRDKGSRRLIILPDGREGIASLPPFLRNLQITSSAQQVVSLLGGIDPRQLQQENRELLHRVDRLREENLALQAQLVNLDRQKDPEAERLKTQLGEVQQELDLAKRRLAEQPPPLPAPGSPTALADRAPLLADEEAIYTLEAALRQIHVETGGGMGGPWITEKGALQVWRSLYAQQRGGAVRSLLSYLENPQRDWKDQWKAITLLTYASRTPEGREQARGTFMVVADLILRGGYVGRAALELIAGTPTSPRLKWEFLFQILEQAPLEKSGDLLRRIPEFTPTQERDRTAEVVADILLYANESLLISYAISALKALNVRTVIPRFRELVAEAPVEKANSLADLLAYFGDRDSVPAIKQAIENWRHGMKSIRILVSSLQALAGPECHQYLAEILVDGHPQLQKEILSGVLPRSNDLTVVAAVTRLAESTPDPAVKELAEKYLASTQ
jgi:hypothetical protein